MNSEEDNVSDEVERREPPLTCILIVGHSGAGKSTLCNTLLAQFSHQKPIYYLNDRSRDPTRLQVAWNKVAELENCCLVVEDLIGTTSAQFKALQELLNYSCHHKFANPIIVITHSILKNNVFGLISFFSHLYVCASVQIWLV
jgi:ABC-type Mn2+/Zn2+ transport system ATPase subunit